MGDRKNEMQVEVEFVPVNVVADEFSVHLSMESVVFIGYRDRQPVRMTVSRAMLCQVEDVMNRGLE